MVKKVLSESDDKHIAWQCLQCACIVKTPTKIAVSVSKRCKCLEHVFLPSSSREKTSTAIYSHSNKK